MKQQFIHGNGSGDRYSERLVFDNDNDVHVDDYANDDEVDDNEAAQNIRTNLINRKLIQSEPYQKDSTFMRSNYLII
jgi:hypothetical protein